MLPQVWLSHNFCFNQVKTSPCPKRGFTLIEMLLVVSLLSLTGLAVYHVIADGIRVWEYSRRYSCEEDVAIFFEKFTADLQNTYRYSRINFDGQKDRIIIPTIVHTLKDSYLAKNSNAYVDQMGAVEYFLQRGKRTIYRRQANYGQALSHKFGEARAIVTPIQSLQLTYIIGENSQLKPRHTLSGQIPLSVKVEVDFVEMNGHLRRETRLINIPLGAAL